MTDALDPKDKQAAENPPTEEPIKEEPPPEPAPVAEEEAPVEPTPEQEPEGETPPVEASDAPAPDGEAPAPVEADAVTDTESAEAAEATEAAPAEGAAAAEGEPSKRSKKRGEPKPEPPDLPRRIEAILFATDQPLSPRRIADALEVGEGRVKEVIGSLREHYDADDRAFTVEEIAGGFQIMTRSDFGGIVKALFEIEREHRLSQAALETLAIVAYKQPIIRAEIEDIRGVQVQPILKTLQEQGLVRIVGRAEQLGRPMLYGTTQKFLMTFGLKSAKDLPPVEELKRKQ